jgi:hypothetical protein
MRLAFEDGDELETSGGAELRGATPLFVQRVKMDPNNP